MAPGHRPVQDLTVKVGLYNSLVNKIEGEKGLELCGQGLRPLPVYTAVQGKRQHCISQRGIHRRRVHLRNSCAEGAG